ncbi:isochorismatase family protein [Leptolyngbya sp. CCNP1308]|uniref:isochorismatase family protein n=1 Tax=Leptolyngbya sp. CCNP1308 TaxID=3110255 RepID=UPI003A59871A
MVSPYKAYGPQSNDLVLQLRKRNISKVLLIGMLANICVEARLHGLIEQGFGMLVVKDATAAPRHSELGDDYKAALINFWVYRQCSSVYERSCRSNGMTPS